MFGLSLDAFSFGCMLYRLHHGLFRVLTKPLELFALATVWFGCLLLRTSMFFVDVAIYISGKNE
jgi:hypothetical protein